MVTVLFDTLALAGKHEAAGFPSKRAQDTAAALAETLGQDRLTRRDLGEVTTLRTEMSELATKLGAEIANVRAEMRELEARLRSEIADVAAEVREFEARFRSEIKESEHRMTIRLGAMMAVSIALVAALVKLL
jgi:broad specificity phosphatase PhoE